MIFRVKTTVAWVLGQVPTVLTLALLAAVGVWGARNDWQVGPFGGREAEPAADEPADVLKVIPDPARPAESGGSAPAAGARVEFPSPEAVRRAGIETAAAQVRRMARYVTANGMLDYEPGYYAELASRAPGTVWSVEKEIGSPVRKGEVLALVESADVGQAKGDFLHDLAQVEVRRQAVERLRAAVGSVSAATRLEAEAALREARIRLFNDQQRLLNFGLALRLADVEGLSEEGRARFVRLLGLPAALRGQVDPETLTANLLPLTAPFDGVIVTRRAAPGEVVGTHQILFIVADTRHLHADLEIHPEDMADVRVGQPVIFQPDKDQGPPARARVSHISPEVNEKSRNVEVHTEINNPDARLRPHTFGTGRILIEERPGAVVVPDAAVQSDGPSYLVFVRVSETVFQARPVRPGLRQDGYTEVGGVRPGEPVVTAGSYLLKSEVLKDRIGGGEE